MSQSAEGFRVPMLDTHDDSGNNDNVASNTKVGSRRSMFQRLAAINFVPALATEPLRNGTSK